MEDAGRAAETEDEDTILAYLRRHPDFFRRHAALLDGLVVANEPAGAVSLVEYQLRRLREQNRELDTRMKSLLRNARENEDLGQRMHRLTLALLGCVSADEFFTRLYETLREEFKVDFAAVRLFVDPVAGGDRGLAEFATDRDIGIRLFADVLDGGKPRCGALDGERVECLFGPVGEAVGSTAVVGLVRGRRLGVVALGSRDRDRYHAGMGTVFLRQLAEVVAELAAPHVEPARGR